MEYNKSKFLRNRTIDWLESNQSNGAFEGFPEADMNFNELSNNELEYYFLEWILEDKEDL